MEKKQHRMGGRGYLLCQGQRILAFPIHPWRMNPSPLEMQQKVDFEWGIFNILILDEENNKGIGGGGCCAIGQDSTTAHRRVNILN